MNAKTISEKSILEILQTGADERIFADSNGRIKYGMSLVDSSIVNRGSCTCNPAIEEDVILYNSLFERASSDNDWIEILDSRNNKLLNEIGLTSDSGISIFFAPSGTDLMYYSLMFSEIIWPERPILNLITCLEELGSGTKMAAQGKYYSEFNQFGERVPIGEKLIHAPIESVFFNARSPKGKILNNEATIAELVRKHPDFSIIINLVYGSKSGIEDNLSIIDHIQGDNLIWNVDMCQFRHSGDLIQKLLSKGSMVMITGSKFYQAPPFAAAILVPENLSKKLENINNWETARDFARVLSSYDIPNTFRARVPFLSKQLNIAAALRWASTLSEIEKYNSIPTDETERVIELWNNHIVERIGSIDGFELMPDQAITNRTIVSFRLMKNDQYLNHEQLKTLHNSIVTQDYLKNYPFKSVFIGQPVAYTDRSFLRLAIGSKNIRSFVANGETQFALDDQILNIIKQALDQFEL